jgi:hypothetical protein
MPKGEYRDDELVSHLLPVPEGWTLEKVWAYVQEGGNPFQLDGPGVEWQRLEAPPLYLKPRPLRREATP